MERQERLRGLLTPGKPTSHINDRTRDRVRGSVQRDPALVRRSERLRQRAGRIGDGGVAVSTQFQETVLRAMDEVDNEAMRTAQVSSPFLRILYRYQRAQAGHLAGSFCCDVPGCEPGIIESKC